MRHAEWYDLGHCLGRCVPCLCRHPPRALLFASDVPASRTDAAWILYDLFQGKMAAPHLAAQPYRISDTRPDSESLCGHPYDGCFGF